MFLAYDPEDDYPVFVCDMCKAWHVTKGCCFDKSPGFISWLQQNRKKDP